MCLWPRLVRVTIPVTLLGRERHRTGVQKSDCREDCGGVSHDVLSVWLETIRIRTINDRAMDGSELDACKVFGDSEMPRVSKSARGSVSCSHLENVDRETVAK